MGKNLQSARRLIVALLALLLVSSSAFAQPADKRKQALAHFKQAEAYMKASAYDKAVEEYQAAYAAVKKPGFLFNIGLAYEAGGDKQKAVEHYRKYLDLDPKGRASAEARARATVLERAIAADAQASAEAERQKRAAEEQRKAADAHVAAAMRHRDGKNWDEAIRELSQAFTIRSDPEYLYEVAEILRLKGDRPAAVVEYQRYRELAPTGPHAVDAIKKITTLEREIEEASRPPVADKPPQEIIVKLPDQPRQPVDKPKKKSGMKWHWVALGALAVVAGVGMDLGPGTSRNGELDPVDFVGAGLYGVGGTLLIMGVF